MVDTGRSVVPNAVLVSHSQQVFAVVGVDRTLPVPIRSRDWLFVLEALVYGGTLEQAYHRFKGAGFAREMDLGGPAGEPVVVRISPNRILVSRSSGEAMDLVGQQMGVLAAHFAGHDFDEAQSSISTLEEFAVAVDQLAACGLVSPARGTLNWGDFRRLGPFCPAFGTSRGTPIDRVYLGQFIEQVRDQVAGVVLEIGGTADNRERYGLQGCTAYHSLEMEAGPGISHVGDAHDSGLFEADSYDAILLFNVLEHCHTPQAVVDNIHRWLKPGGVCLLMVPNAQRVHDYPGDFWRPMPEGVRHLFRDYDETQLFVYGNPTTCIASLMGVSAEELSPQEINVVNPEYPVATCVMATR